MRLKKGWFILCMLLLVTAMVFVGCGVKDTSSEETPADGGSSDTTDATSTEKEGGDADGDYTIALVPKLVGIPYFEVAADGAKQAGEDLGVEVIYTGPTEADAAKQVNTIQDLISKGVDAIAVAPNDAQALTPILKEAQEKGILVLSWDTAAEEGASEYFVNQLDGEVYGSHLMDLLVENMGKEEGKYAIVTGALTASNLNGWIEAAKKRAEEKYPNIELVTDPVPSDEDQQKAFQQAQNLISAYPDLDGFIGVSTPAPIGIAQAVQQAGKQDEIAVVGTTSPDMAREYLKDGSLDGASMWDPAELGYLAISVAKMVLDGEKPGDGLQVEGFEQMEIRGSEIIMGPPLDFTADNVDDYNF